MNQKPFPENFISEIPKADLHVHLDGSLRIPTLIELSKKQKVNLPSYTESGLLELVFKENYANLDEYLRGFGLTCSVMQDEESLERISYEFAEDCWNEGVRYVEVRFAPQLHINQNITFEKVMSAVDRGLKTFRNRINTGLKPDEPPFEYGIIVCAMRFYNENFSYYYNQFSSVHSYSSENQKMRLASIELARATVRIRENTDIQVVGFDLAGSEHGYPADNHRKSYDIIHKHFLHKTVHAGEAYGPESIFQAITRLHAERIGHGLFLFDEKMIFSKKIKNKERYVQDLSNYIADRRITIEVCLTSNLQTVPEIKDIRNHSFAKMLENRLSTALCTDNRLVSHTTVTNELHLALKHFPITPGVLKNLVLYGFKRSFNYHPYKVKREYVRKVIDYYENLEKKYNIRKDYQ